MLLHQDLLMRVQLCNLAKWEREKTEGPGLPFVRYETLLGNHLKFNGYLCWKGSTALRVLLDWPEERLRAATEREAMGIEWVAEFQKAIGALEKLTIRAGENPQAKVAELFGLDVAGLGALFVKVEWWLDNGLQGAAQELVKGLYRKIAKLAPGWSLPFPKTAPQVTDGEPSVTFGRTALELAGFCEPMVAYQLSRLFNVQQLDVQLTGWDDAESRREMAAKWSQMYGNLWGEFTA